MEGLIERQSNFANHEEDKEAAEVFTEAHHRPKLEETRKKSAVVASSDGPSAHTRLANKTRGTSTSGLDQPIDLQSKSKGAGRNPKTNSQKPPRHE